VAIDPTNADAVAVGEAPLYRSLNGTASSPTFQSVGNGTLHVDQNGLAFAAHDVLYDGNDGGIWQISNFSATPSFVNLNTNLANAEFYHGTIDALNYGVSFGGTQDNSTIRGGTPLTWNLVLRNFSGDADGQFWIDPTNSNIAYYATFQQSYAIRAIGYSQTAPGTTLLSNGFPASIAQTSLAMDPSTTGGNRVLVAYSNGSQKVYRTTTADTTAAWSSITADTGRTGNTLPPVQTLTLAPLASSQSAPSNTIFETTGDGSGLWCTTDASRWRGGLGVAGHQLPGRVLTSVAVGMSQCFPSQQACTTACACTLYASISGFDENPTTPSHVFRSSNYTGQDCSTLSWDNVSGTIDTCTNGVCPSTGRACVNNACPYFFPNIPADKVVVDPGNPTLLYLATDLGMFQGCLGCRSSDNVTCNPSGTKFICNASGTVWVWDKLTIGFPQASWARDLSLHQDSRMLRAWTYGRSVWEANLGNVPNPDRKANSSNPTTDVQSASISSTSTGDRFALTWSDDRSGANVWHVRYRSFYNDGTFFDLLDARVDDTTDHVAQAPAVATNSADTTHDQCSWVAWHDDRLNRTNHYNHIYYTYICGDGYKPYADARADTQATNLNATYPAIVFEPTGLALTSVVAWQADRAAVSNPSHDIYARLFSAFGPPGGSVQVNASSSTSDATLVSMATDANSNIYIAWEEHEPGPSPPAEYKIFLSKYDMNFGLQHAPIRIDSAANPSTTVRHAVSVAVDNQSGANGPTVIVTWYEGTGGPEYVVRRRLQIPSSNNYVFLDTNPVQINNPPSVPSGIQRAGSPSVATDTGSNFLIAWVSNVNGTAPNWSDFGKSFDLNGAIRKNDFRIDLAGRALTAAPRVARNSNTGQFAYGWRDNRSGHFDVYARVVPSLP
jgi:hypothetical protein